MAGTPDTELADRKGMTEVLGMLQKSDPSVCSFLMDIDRRVVAEWPPLVRTMHGQRNASIERGDPSRTTLMYYETQHRKSASMMPESFNSMASIIRAANSLDFMIVDPAMRVLAKRGLRVSVLDFHESNKDDWEEDWYPATLMKEILEVLGGTQTP